MSSVEQAQWELKRENWEQYKAESRAEAAWRKEHGRGVGVTIAEPRKHNPCNCQHAPKKHKKTGTCRGACDCNAGVRR